MSTDEFFADLLMLAHAAYALFVVLGLMLILIGMVLGWRWTRDRRFRIIHLAATLFSMLRVGSGWACPFSVAEDALRSHSTAACPLGGAFHEALHHFAFRGTHPGYFAGGVTLFGLLALVAFVLNRERGGKIRSMGTA